MHLEHGFIVNARMKNNQLSNHSLQYGYSKHWLLNGEELAHSNGCPQGKELELPVGMWDQTGWVSSALHNISTIGESRKSRIEQNNLARASDDRRLP